MSSFIPAVVQAPLDPVKTTVELTGPSLINLCNPIIFSPFRVINDGGRGVKMVNWTVESI